jgi:hypothetical protein
VIFSFKVKRSKRLLLDILVWEFTADFDAFWATPEPYIMGQRIHEKQWRVTNGVSIVDPVCNWMPLYKREGGNLKAASYWLRGAGSRSAQIYPSYKQTDILTGRKLRHFYSKNSSSKSIQNIFQKDRMNCSPVYKYILSIFWNFKDEKEEFFLETSHASLTLSPRKWRQCISPKHQLTFARLRGIISERTELFIATSVRTWNSSYLSWQQCLRLLENWDRGFESHSRHAYLSPLIVWFCT